MLIENRRVVDVKNWPKMVDIDGLQYVYIEYMMRDVYHQGWLQVMVKIILAEEEKKNWFFFFQVLEYPFPKFFFILFDNLVLIILNNREGNSSTFSSNFSFFSSFSILLGHSQPSLLRLNGHHFAHVWCNSFLQHYK